MRPPDAKLRILERPMRSKRVAGALVDVEVADDGLTVLDRCDKDVAALHEEAR